jgi:hypothetical protein
MDRSDWFSLTRGVFFVGGVVLTAYGLGWPPLAIVGAGLAAFPVPAWLRELQH